MSKKSKVILKGLAGAGLAIGGANAFTEGDLVFANELEDSNKEDTSGDYALEEQGTSEAQGELEETPASEVAEETPVQTYEEIISTSTDNSESEAASQSIVESQSETNNEVAQATSAEAAKQSESNSTSEAASDALVKELLSDVSETVSESLIEVNTLSEENSVNESQSVSTAISNSNSNSNELFSLMSDRDTTSEINSLTDAASTNSVEALSKTESTSIANSLNSVSQISNNNSTADSQSYSLESEANSTDSYNQSQSYNEISQNSVATSTAIASSLNDLQSLSINESEYKSTSELVADLYDEYNSLYNGLAKKDQTLESLFVQIIEAQKNVAAAKQYAVDNNQYLDKAKNGYYTAADRLAELLITYKLYQESNVVDVDFGTWDSSNYNLNHVKVTYTGTDNENYLEYFDYVTAGANGNALYTNKDTNKNGITDNDDPTLIDHIIVVMKTPKFTESYTYTTNDGKHELEIEDGKYYVDGVEVSQSKITKYSSYYQYKNGSQKYYFYLSTKTVSETKTLAGFEGEEKFYDLTTNFGKKGQKYFSEKDYEKRSLSLSKLLSASVRSFRSDE